MSPWFRRRRRPQEVVADAPPRPQPEPGAVVPPEPEVQPEPPGAPQSEQQGEISPARLDQALDRLRHRIPAREDGSEP